MLKLGYDLLQEAALYVLNTSSIEAALSIFTEVNKTTFWIVAYTHTHTRCSTLHAFHISF